MDFRTKPFDVETTFANASLARRKQRRPLRGPDSPLFAAVWPAVSIVKVFGLAPYEFSNDRLAPSNLCSIFSLACIGLYSYVLYVLHLRFAGFVKSRPKLGGTEPAKVVLNYAVTMYDLIATLLTRRGFASVWNGLQDYDERARQLGQPRSETRTAIVAWTALIVNTVMWTGVNQTGMHAFSETWTYNVGYMIVYVGACVSVYKFAGTCFLLGERFRHLNELARRCVARDSAATRNISKKTIQGLYDDLMVAGETLNSLYTVSLLLWLGNLSMHSVSNMFFVIQWLLDGVISWPLMSSMSVWIVAYLSQLLVLHVACDYASTEAGCMGQIMTDWQVRSIERHPEDEPVETSLHLINRRLHFSAGGCFDVNLPLLCSIAALLSTYLAILLQFPE